MRPHRGSGTARQVTGGLHPRGTPSRLWTSVLVKHMPERCGEQRCPMCRVKAKAWCSTRGPCRMVHMWRSLRRHRESSHCLAPHSAQRSPSRQALAACSRCDRPSDLALQRASVQKSPNSCMRVLHRCASRSLDVKRCALMCKHCFAGGGSSDQEPGRKEPCAGAHCLCVAVVRQRG